MSRVGVWLVVLGATQPAHADPGPIHVFAQRADGTWLSAAQDHVAISRELPSAANEDEAVRVVLSDATGTPPPIRIATRRAGGALLDTLAEPQLSAATCPPGVAATASCWATVPLRLTPDRLDRDHPAAHDRSLEAELGGKLWVKVAGQPLTSWAVGA